MALRPTSPTITLIAVDPSRREPLHRQIYRGLRQAILSRGLGAGARLPSTRMLAGELSVSRNTVLTAFEQLRAEGYLEGRVGGGTYVAAAIPDDLLALPSARPRLARTGAGKRLRSASARAHAETPVEWSAQGGRPGAFRPGLPALDAFPYALWGRLAARRWKRPSPALMAYGDPRGYRPLREAIAAYVAGARGVRCDADQVLMVGGSQQALDFCARVLADRGDVAWLEEPGYIGARTAFLGAGLRIVPVPVDEEGLDVGAGAAAAPEPRLIYLSPSHNFPLGTTMSVARRLQALALASRVGAWVLEDDYDSEFRYAGRPLPALQGLDTESRVVYVGTMSKVLFPSLRLGYLIAPPDLVDALTTARVLSGLHAPAFDQATLADFIVEGHLARHIRRMRSLYEERQEVLLDAARAELAGLLELAPDDAGMHLVGRLRPGADDRDAARRAAERGVETLPLSMFYLGPKKRSGLLLGYSGVRPPTIRRAARELARALEGSD